MSIGWSIYMLIFIYYIATPLNNMALFVSY